MLRFASLLLAIPLAAQSPSGKWSIGIFGASPGLSGHYIEKGDGPGYVANFDFKDDFKLDNDGMGLGFHLDYSGSRFGFLLSYASYEYAGRNVLTKDIPVPGLDEPFKAGYDVTSSLKHTLLEATATFKIFKFDKAWLGVDLGMQSWSVDVGADGVDTRPLGDPMRGQNLSFTEKFTATIPFIGASCGVKGFNDRLELGGKFHFVSYSGASYTRFSADARYFFVKWLGVRAYIDNQSLDAPEDSIVDNIEVKLDRNTVGFGVVARF